MSTKTVQIPFPLGGVARTHNLSAVDKVAYTTWACNMQPTDVFEGRLRGGSRHGLTAYVGANAPVWPTGVLLDETGQHIVDEAGADLSLPITGAGVLYPELLEAMRAFGYANLPETITATVGTAPVGATLGCNYRDRLVLAGDNVVFFSRQGDYTDFDYGADVEDVGRAFILQLSEAGEIGRDVTAIVPHRDAYLLLATAQGMWVLSDDPTTGSLHNVSRDVGIVSSHAWTKVADSIVCLARDGLYSVGANGSGLKSLSADKLPVELKDIDPLNYSVTMGYSHGENGVRIFIAGDQQHWFYDLTMGGFWPFQLPVTVVAAFLVNGELVVQDSAGLLWTFDGEDDNGTGISSHVLYGPFQSASTVEYSMLTSLHGTINVETNGEVTWRVITGTSAETACQAAEDAIRNYLDGDTTEAVIDVVASGKWTEGRSVMAYPRVRAMWIVLWLSSQDAWAFESMVANMRTFGRWRG